MESANQTALTAEQLPIHAYKRDIIEIVSDQLVPFPSFVQSNLFSEVLRAHW